MTSICSCAFDISDNSDSIAAIISGCSPMPTGYVRQDTTGQLANGNPIDADLFNDEYNAIVNAFNASTGHSHDGTTGGGAPISRPSTDNFSEDMLKPFLKATEDITEQGRIFKTYGKETWQKLRDIAKTR